MRDLVKARATDPEHQNWEGDTLVVETTNFSDEALFEGADCFPRWWSDFWARMKSAGSRTRFVACSADHPARWQYTCLESAEEFSDAFERS
jgi:hypothetical protein